MITWVSSHLQYLTTNCAQAASLPIIQANSSCSIRSMNVANDSVVNLIDVLGLGHCSQIAMQGISSCLLHHGHLIDSNTSCPYTGVF